MKSSIFSSVTSDAELRQTTQEIPRDRETLPGFVEQPIRQQVERSNLQQEFIERSFRSGEFARSSGEYYAAGQVLAELDVVLTMVCKKCGK
jgi:hypothetical protein